MRQRRVHRALSSGALTGLAAEEAIVAIVGDVLEASFGGIGNTVPPVIIGLVVAVARFPLAYLLAVALGQGGLGVAWAVNATVVLQTIALGIWFVVRFERMNAEAIREIPVSLPPPAPAPAPAPES
jgi:Na+-driven multidrug efflux pump